MLTRLRRLAHLLREDFALALGSFRRQRGGR